MKSNAQHLFRSAAVIRGVVCCELNGKFVPMSAQCRPNVDTSSAYSGYFASSLALRSTWTCSFSTSTSSQSTLTGEENYKAMRLQELNDYAQKKQGWTGYPRNLEMTTTTKDFNIAFANIDKGACLHETLSLTSGRIISKRDSSRKLIFFDIIQDQVKMQVMCSEKTFKGDFELLRLIRLGDIVAIRGNPLKTKTGELTLRALHLDLLTPCLHSIPEELTCPNTRFRQRYLDWLVNRHNVMPFLLRAKMIASLRKFLNERGFVEVETPILWPAPGGAVAKPFITRSRAFGSGTDMYLRIAPELFLKECVIGGLEKVYEIGKVFRNEGVDATHNPEFTSCEFYEAYQDIEGLMQTTEALIRGILKDTTGGLGLTVTVARANLVCDIDFEPPFRRLDVMGTLGKMIGEPLGDPNKPESAMEYISIYERMNLPLPRPPLSVARLLDGLIGHLIEPTMIQPTFLMNHPICLSPLAKASPSGITHRFELFVAQKEIVNAYEELNEPEEQRQRLIAQQKMKTDGDGEAMVLDEHFCTALEYGLPPTVGWGMGLDRLLMLIASREHIREVLLFPVTRPDTSESEKK